MADTKITALTALTAADPANDVIPIVDVSDTSMAASGTTKKISVNNILGASGTATLASAAITGAATVGTTLGVTGVSTFAAGTAALPALTTTGDTNTGIYYPAADTFAVTTGGTERYRVDSGGNLGIGVTPSVWNSAVKGLQLSTYGAIGASSGNMNVYGNLYSSASGTAYLANGFGNLLQMTSGQFVFYQAGNNTLGAGTIATLNQAVTLDASGNFLVGVTSANANGGVLQLKSGITFPATQVAASDANTLDDYEEGTFTPNIGGTATYTTQTGRYTKIGNRVYFTLSLEILLAGTGEDYRISGLPFASAVNSTVSIGYFGLLKSNQTYLSGSIFGTQINMSGTTVATASMTNSPGVIGNGTNLLMSGFFNV